MVGVCLDGADFLTRAVVLALAVALTLGNLTFLAGLVSSFLTGRFLGDGVLEAFFDALDVVAEDDFVLETRALVTAFLTPALSDWEPRSFLLLRREVEPSKAFPMRRFALVTLLLALLVVERDFFGVSFASLSFER